MKGKTYIIIILLIFIMAGIVHNVVKASGQKGLAVEWNANHDITANVDMGQFSWVNQVIENLNAFPGGPVEGQIVWRADLNGLYIWDGANWIIYFSSPAAANLDMQDFNIEDIGNFVFHDGGATVDIIRDEDDMVSNDANALATQQSIRAFTNAKVSDAAYGAGWNAVTTIAPSKNAVYDQLVIHYASASVHHNAPSNLVYGAGWNGINTTAPSKNAVYDTLSGHYANASAHHAKYTDANARGAINNIFGADGHADANIDMDNHKFVDMAAGAADADSIRYGQVAIKSGTYYWSCSGNHFTGCMPDTDAIEKHPDEGELLMEVNGICLTGAVNLPHGAVVTAAKVYGSEADEDWYLRRMEMGNPGFAITMATAKVGTEDNTIGNATINNSQYAYFFEVCGDANDVITGARIIYTL